LKSSIRASRDQVRGFHELVPLTQPQATLEGIIEGPSRMEVQYLK